MSKEKANERINGRIAYAEEPGKSHTFPIVVAVVVIIAVLIGIICFLALRKEPEQESREYNRVVTPDNIEEIISQLDASDYTPVGSYEVLMNTNWVFPDAASPSTNAYVENSINNRNTVFFTIALKSDRDTNIYDSPFLAPGSYMEAIQLDTELPEGRYDAVLTYHLVDESEKEISHVSVSITLAIGN